ncbi:MAG: porin family protein [Bacteroidia bacterium]
MLWCGSVAYSQTFRAGFTAGLSASDINGAHTINRNRHFSKAGLIAGFLVNTQISKKSVFQMELNFIQKGSLQRPDSLGNGYYKIALSYVEVPLLFRRQLYFTKKGVPVNRFDIELGASVGRLVGYSVTNNANTVFTGNETAKYLNFTDVSLLIGFDCNITKTLGFSVRYSNSVIPAIKHTPNIHFITYTFNRGNNQVLQFSLKYVLKGKATDTTPKVQDASGQDSGN